jgi:hypothetical protein
VHAARAQRWCDAAAPAHIQRLRETVRRVIQPVQQAPGQIRQHIGHRIDQPSRPIPMHPHRPLIKDVNWVHKSTTKGAKVFCFLFSKKKALFFEKKKQKTFAICPLSIPAVLRWQS